MLNMFFNKELDQHNPFEIKNFVSSSSEIECANGETYKWLKSANKWVNNEEDRANPTFTENLELTRQQTKLLNEILFLAQPYKTETNKRTNVEIGYYGISKTTPDLKVTLSDGREYVRIEGSQWYNFPDFHKCNEGTSHSLQGIVEQTELSNRKTSPQNLKPRRSGLWIQR